LLGGFDLKGGRFEFFDGQELMPDEPQLRWLVNNRIAQRLVANFGFSDAERSFDGAAASHRSGPWQFTALYGVPTKGVFDVKGWTKSATWISPPRRSTSAQIRAGAILWGEYSTSIIMTGAASPRWTIGRHWRFVPSLRE
jgi:hypothetical protein